jgi:hypothetical protein
MLFAAVVLQVQMLYGLLPLSEADLYSYLVLLAVGLRLLTAFFTEVRKEDHGCVTRGLVGYNVYCSFSRVLWIQNCLFRIRFRFFNKFRLHVLVVLRRKILSITDLDPDPAKSSRFLRIISESKTQLQ